MGFGSVAWDREHPNGDERQPRGVKAASHHAEPSPARADTPSLSPDVPSPAADFHCLGRVGENGQKSVHVH